jgi:hypothetical protein
MANREAVWRVLDVVALHSLLYAVTPVGTPVQSPFANVTGQSVKGVTSKDLMRTVREEGWSRGARVIRSTGTGRLPRAKTRVR